MPSFDDAPVRTPADELLDLVKKAGKLTVSDAAKYMKVPVASVQGLVDFLVEEKVLGIEYKFTTPYIYINEPGAGSGKAGKAKSFVTKEQFWQKAKKKNIPPEKIDMLWKKYLQENLPSIRNEFMKQAKVRGLSEDRMEMLWQKYLNNL